MWWLIALFFVGFLLVHLAKMTRLYLVLMEHKIPFGKFVLLYLKTTLVNFIIPFKLGEIYRFYCVSRQTKHWQVGILSILVDRFFDILALCVILVPCDLYMTKWSKLAMPNLQYYVGGLSIVTWIFIAALVLIALIYITIEPSYFYLNHYLIKEKSSQRSLVALRALDIIKQWFDFTKNLIKGRFALIFLASLMGWIFEIATIKIMTMFMGVHFGVVDFVGYIQAIFGVGTSLVSKPYILFSVIIVACFTLQGLAISFVQWIARKRRA